MNEQIFTNILDYKVFNGTRKQFINYIEKFEKVNIISGNPEVLYNGLENPVSKILKNPVAEKIAGIDIMKQIIEKCEIENKAVYFLGAEQNVLENCIENLRNIHKNLNIVGSHNGFFDLENCNNIIEDIKEKRPYAIFVAMGSPRQDIFISRNMEKLPCNIFMGVGGSFDVFAGKVKRAPKWMVNIGIEWLYRVIKEPWRIKRLISIPKFLINIIQYNRK
jgi:N-acetylglucosaminyldiphosphoundecaprenol N-acetyl-beta-D-mannosaminyltransferase